MENRASFGCLKASALAVCLPLLEGFQLRMCSVQLLLSPDDGCGAAALLGVREDANEFVYIPLGISDLVVQRNFFGLCHDDSIRC